MTILIDPMPRRQCSGCKNWDRDNLNVDPEQRVVGLCGQEFNPNTGETRYKIMLASGYCLKWEKRT